MKSAIVVPAAIVLSAAVSFAVARLASPPPPPIADTGATSEEMLRLAGLVADLQRGQESLLRTVDGLRDDVAAVPDAGSRVPVGEIEAAIARALESRAAAAAGDAGETVSASAVSEGKKADLVQATFEKLLAEGLSEEEAGEIWKAAVEAGQLDDLVALFEQRAKANPNEPDAQLDLGRAYLQKVFKAGGGPEAGVWAMKADKAFDAAIALDDHHWESRFSKAVSLSFWPPVLGKQGEAIHHFETLIEQQAHVDSEPGFAQTWLLLGNMYQQIGKSDKALATWQKGLALFPGDTSLQEQIANAQPH